MFSYHEPALYEIKVQAVLEPSWSEWFDGMQVHPQSGGVTLLSGVIRDQTALHGLLGKIRDMGLPLLAVNRVDPAAQEAEEASVLLEE